MQLQENTLFANRYELIKLLGRGGFSEVWLAKDNWTHLKIALKVYAPGQGMDANGLQEFCGELASVYDLNHSNLLKPQHVDTWENMPYLIMAYCSEGSCASKVGQMSEDAMWKFIHDVASGLAYLHSKDVVHQDIKPDNILIDDSGNYLITDFGVSTRARSTLRKSVVSSTAGGTTAYMGPERFSKQPAPTKASDIWSFGAMCFELLEGEVPFGEIGGGMQKGGAEIPAIQANVSDALKFTITKMLQKETWDRPIAKTLIEWTNDPSKIEIDYDLLTEEDGENQQPDIDTTKESKGVGRETKIFGHNETDEQIITPSAEQEEVKPILSKKKKGNSIGAIIGWVIFIIVAFGLIIWGISATVSNNQEKKAIIANHDAALRHFERNLNQANMDSIGIEALQNALNYLNAIKRYEDNPKYVGGCVYTDRHSQLKQKVTTIYKQVDGKYNRAPAGSDIERTLLQKRKRIQEIKKKL
ncbi:MAG: serine/threonine protein kinase [Paludibacteraceae bacterium]|nr:serine/threonine protein kinase [Paludibacteraceae bacterium]